MTKGWNNIAINYYIKKYKYKKIFEHIKENLTKFFIYL